MLFLSTCKSSFSTWCCICARVPLQLGQDFGEHKSGALSQILNGRDNTGSQGNFSCSYLTLPPLQNVAYQNLHSFSGLFVIVLVRDFLEIMRHIPTSLPSTIHTILPSTNPTYRSPKGECVLICHARPRPPTAQPAYLHASCVQRTTNKSVSRSTLWMGIGPLGLHQFRSPKSRK